MGAGYGEGNKLFLIIRCNLYSIDLNIQGFLSFCAIKHLSTAIFAGKHVPELLPVMNRLIDRKYRQGETGGRHSIGQKAQSTYSTNLSKSSLWGRVIAPEYLYPKGYGFFVFTCYYTRKGID
jgi:hypothetical protein